MTEGVGKAKARGKRKNTSTDCHGADAKKKKAVSRDF
jgi:hypothetical protein